MTAPTYSVATAGYRPGNPFAIKNLTIPDTSANGNSAAGPFSVQQMVMSSGDLILTKSQTGALRYHRIDAERSNANLIVLLPV